MDTVPFLFTEAVQILLMTQTDFLSGPWAFSAFFDRRRENPRKDVTLNLVQSSSGTLYNIECSEPYSPLSLEHTLLKNYELRSICVNWPFHRGMFKLDSRACRALRAFISKTETEVFVYIRNYGNDPTIQSFFDVVPRYYSVFHVCYNPSTDRKLAFEAMQTMKVKSVDLGRISMTHYLFSQICAFIQNPIFRSISFTAHTDSEIPAKTVFEAFCRRLRELLSQGKNAILIHGGHTYEKTIGDIDLTTIWEKDGLKSDESDGIVFKVC
ncbi:hypothetical protein L596_029789 [Steinernema carpocapsae]|uniref:Uncharacterized protein n=1 Tax=Steinernema carpocapsae TaxID=34508 RepID=A0A4U5LQS8_STECR|nr:hypothetical protein L596_029789 [Steinernema carpocapsae]